MMKLKRITFVSYITNLVGFVVLLSLVVFAIWATTLLQQSVSAVRLSASVSSTYQHMLFVLAEEETFQYEYQIYPSTALRDEHLAKATVLAALVQVLQQDADTGNDIIAQHVSTQQATYLFYSGQLFSAIDAKDFTRASFIRTTDVTPLFSQIEQELTQQTSIEEAQSAHDLSQLTRVQQTIFVGAPVIFVIGLLLIVFTMYVQRSYRRKLDEATQTEIAHLEHLLSTDPLTGLGNHYAYQEHLSRAFVEAQHGGEPLILALLDIDEFKVINDEQGHQRGDEILCTVATMLREAKLSNALFRLGADEATQTEIAHLEHLLSTDPLTGLGNHYAYQEHLSCISASSPTWR